MPTEADIDALERSSAPPPRLYRFGAALAERPWPLSAIGVRICAAVLAWTFRKMPRDVYGHALSSAADLVRAKAERDARRREGGKA